MNLNQCNFIGRLGADPEIRYMPNGDMVANLSIAVSETWKDNQSGEAREKTEWVRIVAFRKLAEIIGQYLKKGAPVFISGKMKTRKWTDNAGQERYTTEVVLGAFRGEMTLLDSRNAGGASDGGFAPSFDAPAAAGWDSKPAAAPAAGGLDDEIPF